MFSILFSYVNRRKHRFEKYNQIFLLNRWGGNVGALLISIILNAPSGQQQVLLWDQTETQPREWRQGHINLRDIPYDFAVKIDGFVGNGWEGDVCRKNAFFFRKY